MKTKIILAAVASLALATSAFAQATSDQKQTTSKDKPAPAANMNTAPNNGGAMKSGTTGAASKGAVESPRKQDANEKP